MAHPRSGLWLMIRGRTLAELSTTWTQSSLSNWASENTRFWGLRKVVSSVLCLKTLCLSSLVSADLRYDWTERRTLEVAEVEFGGRTDSMEKSWRGRFESSQKSSAHHTQIFCTSQLWHRLLEG